MRDVFTFFTDYYLCRVLLAYKIALRAVLCFLEKKEMSIPSQQHYLVGVPFTGVMLLYYVNAEILLGTIFYWLSPSREVLRSPMPMIVSLTL